jgi:hypothetical protein
MAETFATLLSRIIESMVRGIVVPVTGVIGFLVSSGVMVAVSAALWLSLAVALVAHEAAVDDAWRWIGTLPPPVLGLAWLVFLPTMAGLWVWTTDWPLALRLIVVAGLAVWNLLIFIPTRARRTEVRVDGMGIEPAGAER